MLSRAPVDAPSGEPAMRLKERARISEPARECGRRPLYLCFRAKAAVQADGPALRVRSPARSDCRYPLDRISRVIAGVRVDWSASALQACLESRIPIVIVGADGLPLGSMLPVHVSASTASDALNEFLEHADWPGIYGNWLRATRMRAVVEFRSERDRAGRPLDPVEFKELVRQYVYGKHEARPFGGAGTCWRAAIYGLAVSALCRWGLQPVYWGAGDLRLDIMNDLAGILELMLRLEVRSGMEHNMKGDAMMLRVFHAISGKLDVRCGQVIESLGRRVKRVLAEWR